MQGERKSVMGPVRRGSQWRCCFQQKKEKEKDHTNVSVLDSLITKRKKVRHFAGEKEGKRRGVRHPPKKKGYIVPLGTIRNPPPETLPNRGLRPPSVPWNGGGKGKEGMRIFTD